MFGVVLVPPVSVYSLEMTEYIRSETRKIDRKLINIVLFCSQLRVKGRVKTVKSFKMILSDKFRLDVFILYHFRKNISDFDLDFEP